MPPRMTLKKRISRLIGCVVSLSVPILGGTADQEIKGVLPLSISRRSYFFHPLWLGIEIYRLAQLDHLQLCGIQA